MPLDQISPPRRRVGDEDARGAAGLAAAAEAAAESESMQMSTLELRRESGTCGQGAGCPGLRATAVAVAVTGLLVVACGSGPQGGGATVAPPAAPVAATADCDSVTTCYTPRQLQVAYGIRPLLDRGIDGRGQTVVLPELAESQLSPPLVSDLRQDMAAFDRLFHLPAARLRVVSTFPGPVSPWLAFGEEVLDAEMVHAVAPGAAITIVLVKSTSLDNTGAAVTAAVAALRMGISQGGIISFSAAGQIGGEHGVTRAQVARVHAALQAAASRHVTVVAASGDLGAAGEPCDVFDALTGRAFPLPVREVNLLAADPLVLGAGGTTLTASHATGAYIGEIAWGLPYGTPGGSFQASGGGFSRLFARPAYQDGVPGTSATRGVPDVAADASGHTGMALAISADGKSYSRNSGGTSATAPLWAGIIALADQYAGRHLGFVNPALYRIARTPAYHQAFHDITRGTNTVQFPPKTITGYHAAPGWDPVTGLGSPNAQALIPPLARYTSP
jgi:subtilase family serine protease